ALNNVQKAWKKSRLNRMLIDHLLREGMYDTARTLSEDLKIKELTNVDVSEKLFDLEVVLQFCIVLKHTVIMFVICL
ncbi:LisH domain-containing protein, partial [Citrobacter freundii]|uniref:LisH domain-containing protein n=1 Tax=Citrobacter freundii TaxID=546 RepID=UPI0038BCD968